MTQDDDGGRFTGEQPIPPNPLPGGFRADEFTSEDLREMRDTVRETRDTLRGVGRQNGVLFEWGEMKGAFGDMARITLDNLGRFHEEAKEERRTFRDEAVNDRRMLFEIAKRQSLEGRSNLDKFIAEGNARRDDMEMAVRTLGAGMDVMSTSMQMVQTSLVAQQKGFASMEASFAGQQKSDTATRRYVFAGAAVLMAASLVLIFLTAAGWQRMDRIEQRFESEASHGPRTTTATTRSFRASAVGAYFVDGTE